MESIIESLSQYYIEESKYQDIDSISQPDSECYDDNYYPNLHGFTIDDILTQDDPPKELYLGYDLLDYIEEEYILQALFKEKCCKK